MNIYNYHNFPHPKYENENFIFKNGNFHNTKNKDEIHRVLEFSENKEGWSNELAEMNNLDVNVNHPIAVASREMCINFLEKYEKSKEKIVLEIGCSNDSLINEIVKLGKYNYIGSDAIKNHIYKLSNDYKNIPFVTFDLLKNPFKKSISNALIMLNVLEHIKDDNKALIEANKILSKDGILILEVPSEKSLYDVHDKKLLHFRRYNMQDIIKKVEDAGFTIEKKTHLGFIIFPIFAIIKLFNKFFKGEDKVVKQSRISNNIFLKILFNIEKKFQKLYLPFGIRCYICARKK